MIILVIDVDRIFAASSGLREARLLNTVTDRSNSELGGTTLGFGSGNGMRGHEHDDDDCMQQVQNQWRPNEVIICNKIGSEPKQRHPNDNKQGMGCTQASAAAEPAEYGGEEQDCEGRKRGRNPQGVDAMCLCRGRHREQQDGKLQWQTPDHAG